MCINEIDATAACCRSLLPATVNIDWPHCTDSSCTHARTADRIVHFFIAQNRIDLYTYFAHHIKRARHSFFRWFDALKLFAQDNNGTTFGRSTSLCHHGDHCQRSMPIGQWVIALNWTIFAISFVIDETFAFFGNFSLIGGQTEIAHILYISRVPLCYGRLRVSVHVKYFADWRSRVSKKNTRIFMFSVRFISFVLW